MFESEPADSKKATRQLFNPVKLKNINMNNINVMLLWHAFKKRQTFRSWNENQHLKIFFLKQEVGQKKTVKEVKRADFQIIFFLVRKKKKIPGSFLNIGSVGILGQIPV